MEVLSAADIESSSMQTVDYTLSQPGAQRGGGRRGSALNQFSLIYQSSTNTERRD